jgi:hypothetical protein
MDGGRVARGARTEVALPCGFLAMAVGIAHCVRVPRELWRADGVGEGAAAVAAGAGSRRARE